MNYSGTRGLLIATLLLAGCTGNVGPSTGNNDPANNSTGATGGSGAAPNTGGSGATVTSGGTGATTTGGTGGSGAVGSGGTISSGGTGAAPSCTPGLPATSQVPRLANIQYDRAIRDLVGLTNITASSNVTPSTLLATDQAGGLTDLGWSAYRSVADLVSKQVMADAALKTKYLKCDPAADSACLHSTILEFGRRAFRRPLTPEEIARFDAIVASGATITPTGAPNEVAEALLYMFLISPSFIMRSEITETADGAGHFTLSQHEVASRLSFMLWGSIPDDALNQAADAGMLSTPEQVLGQAQRMLQDQKAHDMVNAFHQYYLLMGAGTRWGTARKDPALFPAFKDTMIGTLTEETLRFFDYIAFSAGGSFKDYLLSPVAFVTAETAPLYGLPAAQFGTELTQTNLDVAQRPGFLTRLGFLNNFANYSRSSPIFRGAFITKQILGIHVDSPPPGAEQTMLPASTAELNTNRKQYEAMTTGPDCSGCHQAYINPPGFVMEGFNAIGAWQTQEATTGAPIDMVADVTIDDALGPVRITNPAELMAQIANAPGAMRQYAKKWVSFAYEREGDPLDACTAEQLAAKMTVSGYTVLNLIADLTQTQSFRVRAVEVP